MKIATTTLSAAAAALAVAVAPLSFAGGTPTDNNPYLPVLSASTQAELPAKAANIVVKATAKERRQTTIEVVKAAVGLNPAAAAVIVGSIAQTTPAMAATAAGTAAGLAPNEAANIARAAAAAAPKQAGAIVEAICRALPSDYSVVAETVADVVPSAGREILTGVATAIPSLKGPIDRVLASQKGGVPSVVGTFNQLGADSLPPSFAAMAGGGGPMIAQPADLPPMVQPPYQTPPTSPVNLNPGNGGTVPPNGRQYSNP